MNYNVLKNSIAAVIKANGNEEITGELLQQVLLSMINSLGNGYQFIGVASTSTNPGTPDQNVFYLASTAGTYTNFGGLVLADGEVAILKYNGTWAKETTGVATINSVNQLDQDVNGTPNNVNLYGDYYLVGGVITAALNFQKAYLFPVKTGDVVHTEDLAHPESTIYWGVFQSVPEPGDAADSYGTILGSGGDITIEENGYIFLSHYKPYDFTFYFVGIKQRVKRLETDIDDVNNKVDNKVDKNVLMLGNLFNKDSAGIISGKYLGPSTGVLADNAECAVSDYIPVIGNVPYHLSLNDDMPVGNVNMAVCLYGENKNLIIALNERDYQTIEFGLTVKFVRFSYRLAEDEQVQFEIGKYRSNYKPYNDVEGYLNNENKKYSNTIKSNTLVPNTPITFSNFPDGCKFGNSFSVFANIPNGIGNGIRIGWGYLIIGGCYIVIDDTNISVYKSTGSDTNSQLLVKQVAHGLTLNTYIKAVGWIDDNIVLHINIMSLSGSYETTITEVGRYQDYNEDFRGSFEIYTLSVNFTDVVANIANSRLSKPIWIFGDSYMTICDEIRPGYQLNQIGVLKDCFVQAFGGETPADAWERLLKALSYGKPKYIIWAEGMNGAYHLGVTGYDQIFTYLSALCEKLNISLILYAPPVPALSAALPADKQQITEFVRGSGYRFIDAYKAVGSNSTGEWYGDGEDWNYQAGDKVHTTVMGAKAIASQFLIDFPELLNQKEIITYN